MTATESLQSLLETLRRQRRRRLLLEAAAIVVVAVVAATLVGLTVTATFGRTGSGVLAARLLGYAIVLGAIVKWLVLPLVRRASDAEFALYVEERAPELKQALISAVHEIGQPDAERGSPALAARVVQHAARALEPLASARAIELPREQRAQKALAIAVVAAGLLLAFGPAGLRDAARILFAPWSVAIAATPPAPVVDVEPGDADVPRGGALDIRATLAHFTAEILARVRVSELVDEDDDAADDPQRDDVGGRDAVERIRRRECAHEFMPSTREQTKVDGEQRARPDEERSREHPAEIRDCSRQQRVGVAKRPAHPEQFAAKELRSSSLVALGAQSFELQRGSLGDRPLEKARGRHFSGKSLDRLTGNAQTLVRQQRRDLRRRTPSVEAAHDANLRRAEPKILLRGEVFDYKARLAAIDLLRDRQIGAKAWRGSTHEVTASAERAARPEKVRSKSRCVRSRRRGPRSLCGAYCDHSRQPPHIPLTR